MKTAKIVVTGKTKRTYKVEQPNVYKAYMVLSWAQRASEKAHTIEIVDFDGTLWTWTKGP